MSFVTAVRDYVDWINATFDSFHHTFGGEMTFSAFVNGTFVYLWHSAKVAFLYIFTFQWLRDLAYLPVLLPEITLDTIRETYDPTNEPFDLAFLGTPTLLQNKFLVGFFNSFFAALPFSLAHFIGIRQFYLKGWRAALATHAGIILGHIFFLAAVFFGWRPVLIPWLQWEPWNFLLPLVILFATIRDAYGRYTFTPIYEWPGLLKSLAIGFLLTISDQGGFFKYITSLTGGLEPTYLEPITGTASSLTQQHTLYILGFFIGSILFTAGVFALFYYLREAITDMKGISIFRFASDANYVGTHIFVFCFAVSLPFYGFDYLVANPLGYVPTDRVLTPGLLKGYTKEDDQLSIYGFPGRQATKIDIDVEETEPEIGVAFTKAKKQKLQKTKTLYRRTPRFPPYRDYDYASYDRGVYFRHAVRGNSKVWTPESYRIPSAQIRSSARLRHKRHAGFEFFNRFLKSKYGRKAFEEESKPGVTRAGKMTAKARRAAVQARLRARKLARPYRLVRLLDGGSRQQFDQFTVNDNITLPWDPYTDELTSEQREILGKIDALLKQVEESPDLASRIYIPEIETLMLDYEDTTMFVSPDGPLNSRTSIVEQASKLLVGQLPPGPKKNRRRLGVWHNLFSYAYYKKPKSALRQRVMNLRLRQNPYMHTLFQTDIDAFLARQPKDQMLTAKEESELYFKRVMLKNFVHTHNKLYRRVFRQNDVLRTAFNSGKSIANKVYNHQFNGTHKVVRQLMRVDLDSVVNRTGARVMKYDMPLFKKGKDRMTSVHEELFGKMTRRRTNPRKRKRLHPQVYLQMAANTRPFYAGWDGDRRAFVLTNRFLPKRVSSRAMRLNENYPEFAPLRALAMETKSKPATSKKMKRIVFTTWPISSKTANDPLRYRVGPRALMGQRPTRYDLHRIDEGQLQRQIRQRDLPAVMRAARGVNARFIVRSFLPTFDMERAQILLDEANKPNVDEKAARAAAAKRIASMPPPQSREPVFIYSEPWPSGFIVHVKRLRPQQLWWLEEKPPLPFVDRGSYVWPGHAQLKINLQHYLPKWKAPTFSVKNPFTKND